MAAVDPGSGGVRDRDNAQAKAYARHMLELLVRHHVINSVAGAVSHFGGDITAAWRGLSGLTGAPHTYMGATGTGSPIPSPEAHRAIMPVAQQLMRSAGQLEVRPLAPPVHQVAGPLNPIEVLMRLAGGRR